MALILNIDTATEAGSVCLARDGVSLGSRINLHQKDHAAVIVPFIQEIFKACNIDGSQIEAVAISGGPGSYTGLRVAASTAKGLCYAWGVPLIAVNTLEVMADGMRSTRPYGLPAPGYFCPVIDARRMDVFTALYDADLQLIVQPTPMTVDENFLAQYQQQPVCIFGTGMGKIEKLLSHKTNWFFQEFTCHATYLAPLAERAFHEKQFQDLAYYEPAYLKPFYRPPAATPAKS